MVFSTALLPFGPFCSLAQPLQLSEAACPLFRLFPGSLRTTYICTSLKRAGFGGLQAGFRAYRVLSLIRAFFLSKSRAGFRL